MVICDAKPAHEMWVYKRRRSAPRSPRTHGKATVPTDSRRRNTEMNTTEKLYLPVDGIFEMFNSAAGHHRSRVTHPVLRSPAFTPVLQHPSVSSIPKTGFGIIKTVKGRWRQQDRRVVLRRSSSSGNRHASNDLLPKRSVDLLEMGLTKPSNCHRIVVLGAPKAGKTNILRRFLGRDFEEQYEPTTEDFHRKLFHIGGESYQVDLLDAASERDFPAKRRLSILTGDLFLVVFALDDRESFNEVSGLLNDIRAARAKLVKVKGPARRIPVVVCGNKVDLDSRRAVRPAEVTEVLGEDALYFETSAKDGTGLEEVFGAVASLGGLPDETGPSRHQLVSILAYQSLCLGKRDARRALRRRGPHGAPPELHQRPSAGAWIKHQTQQTREVSDSMNCESSP